MLTDQLETERLVVRRFEVDDWRFVHEYTSRPETMEYMEEEVMDEAGAQTFVQKQMTDDVTAYAMVRKDDARLIGHMIYHPWFAASYPRDRLDRAP